MREEEILGMHFSQADELGNEKLWLLVRISGGTNVYAELRAFSIDGTSQGKWVMPSGRNWAPGLCSLGSGRNFVAAAIPKQDTAGCTDFAERLAATELWH